MEISGTAAPPTPLSPANDTFDLIGDVQLKSIALARGTLTIPPGKLGTVFFAAKTRVFPPGKLPNQLPNADGLAKIWITVERKALNGNLTSVATGPTGIQQILPGTESGRTISASL